MAGGQHDPQAQRYEIRVRGHLGATMLSAFPALRAELRDGDTLLRGALPDQSALHGVLAQIEALGLELLDLRRLPGGPQGLPPPLPVSACPEPAAPR
jgi:hypothetical protein